jgi:hypothetical protein
MTPMNADKNKTQVIVFNLRSSAFICGQVCIGLFQQPARIQPAAAEVGSLVYFPASHEAGAITGQAFSINGGKLA